MYFYPQNTSSECCTPLLTTFDEVSTVGLNSVRESGKSVRPNSFENELLQGGSVSEYLSRLDGQFDP